MPGAGTAWNRVEQVEDSVPICRHFLAAGCWAGRQCRYLHPEELVPIIQATAGGAPLCAFYLEGSCTYGDRCRNRHVDTNALVKQEPDGSLTYGEADLILGDGSKLDAECGICYESIRGRRQRFGHLENCEHAFCLECIRSWRRMRDQDKDNLRRCPVCRIESYFVLPAEDLLADDELRLREAEAYRQHLRKTPCKWFNFGKGTCPFSTSCFYAHLNADGTKAPDPVIRKLVGADEETQVMKNYTLADYIFRPS